MEYLIGIVLKRDVIHFSVSEDYKAFYIRIKDAYLWKLS